MREAVVRGLPRALEQTLTLHTHKSARGIPTSRRTPIMFSLSHMRTLDRMLCSPEGFHCPRETTQPFPCTAGKYQPSAGKDQCLPCRDGKHSVENAANGTVECTICAWRFYLDTSEADATCTATLWIPQMFG